MDRRPPEFHLPYLTLNKCHCMSLSQRHIKNNILVTCDSLSSIRDSNFFKHLWFDIWPLGGNGKSFMVHHPQSCNLPFSRTCVPLSLQSLKENRFDSGSHIPLNHGDMENLPRKFLKAACNFSFLSLATCNCLTWGWSLKKEKSDHQVISWDTYISAYNIPNNNTEYSCI